MPLAISDSELEIIMNAARPLRVADRDPFLRTVAAELERLRNGLGPGTVYQVVRAAQREFYDAPDLSGGLSKYD